MDDFLLAWFSALTGASGLLSNSRFQSGPVPQPGRRDSVDRSDQPPLPRDGTILGGVSTSGQLADDDKPVLIF